MSWNYRILAHETNNGCYFEIYEVYYDKNNKPNGYTSEPISVGGNDLKEIADELKRMATALEKPILYVGEKFPQVFSESKTDIVDEQEVKKYQIEFGNHVGAEISVKNNQIKVETAMNGWGDKIPLEQIKIIPEKPLVPVDEEQEAKSKWEVFAKAYPLGDTGDYTSECGIKNKDYTFFCSNPDGTTNEELQEICDKLNKPFASEDELKTKE